MMTHDPAEPNEPSTSIVSMASNASSRVIATTTPFPAANPSALTTMGAP
uniref:Phosphoribosylamine--glycine ligase n=1 Tax=Arundo donax TaxID=35708 RepID=A0A0A9D1E3_ARUDO